MAAKDMTKRDNRNDFSEFILDVENRIVQLNEARRICIKLEIFILDMEQRGHINSSEAERLLNNMDKLRHALADGRKFGQWLLKPPVEIEAMILARHSERKRQ